MYLYQLKITKRQPDGTYATRKSIMSPSKTRINEMAEKMLKASGGQQVSLTLLVHSKGRLQAQAFARS